jgi:hypothetical protein
MAIHTELPPVVGGHAPTQAVDHLPTELPPPSTPPPSGVVTLPEDVQISETGVNHLPPDLFSI